jgi:hypothetical protein
LTRVAVAGDRPRRGDGGRVGWSTSVRGSCHLAVCARTRPSRRDRPAEAARPTRAGSAGAPDAPGRRLYGWGRGSRPARPEAPAGPRRANGRSPACTCSRAAEPRLGAGVPGRSARTPGAARWHLDQRGAGRSCPHTALDDRRHGRTPGQAVEGGDHMGGRAHERDTDHLTAGEQVGQPFRLEVVQPRPQAVVPRVRLLGLQPAKPLDRLEHRQRPAPQQQLPLEPHRPAWRYTQ